AKAAARRCCVWPASWSRSTWCRWCRSRRSLSPPAGGRPAAVPLCASDSRRWLPCSPWPGPGGGIGANWRTSSRGGPPSDSPRARWRPDWPRPRATRSVALIDGRQTTWQAVDQPRSQPLPPPPDAVEHRATIERRLESLHARAAAGAPGLRRGVHALVGLVAPEPLVVALLRDHAAPGLRRAGRSEEERHLA